MHVHVSRVRRDGKTYEYAQLVESYRRDDGMPSQRVIAKLGQLSVLELDNFRAALKASRDKRHVVVSSKHLPKGSQFVQPTENLRYLDVAVLLKLWRQLGLDATFERLVPRGDAEVAPCDVIAALTLQRCVDPGSKLYAERWFPHTALPELLGVQPGSFNNTRLHRVLEKLDEVTPTLMNGLPKMYEDTQGQFTTLFLDVTDTWFVGKGPELAQRSKTKEGFVRRKVGIVLLCNQHGFPVRWEVIAGKQSDGPAMHHMLSTISGLSWVGTTPVVVDRAMGTGADIGRMLGAKLHFVTALRRPEIGSYTQAVPHDVLANLTPETDACLEEAGRRVAAAGMTRASSTLYTLDLGVVERHAASDQPVRTTDDPIVNAIVVARQIEQMIQRGEADSFTEGARRLGHKPSITKWYKNLLKLDAALLQEVLEGQASGLSVSQLVRIAKLGEAGDQRKAFEELVLASVDKPARRVVTSDAAPSDAKQLEPPATHRVRLIVAFNPEKFVEQRSNAEERLDTVRTYVAKLNVKLQKPRSRRTPKSISRELDRFLGKKKLLDVFDVAVDATTVQERTVLRATLTLKNDTWLRHRRYDGFLLIVAHPDITLNAVELSKLYRAKDAVEKDFQAIKSLVDLRPIWHRNDAKVRAHVTLCMLALLLQRTLDLKLKNIPFSAALETLATCNLNRFDSRGYAVTLADSAQLALLRTLKFEELADDERILAEIRPR